MTLIKCELKQVILGLAAVLVMSAASSASIGQVTKDKPGQAPQFIYGWARVATRVTESGRSLPTQIDRAYYTDITAFVPTVDPNALKQNVTAYFNRSVIPDAARVSEKVDVKDIYVKTFPTLVEADNARFAAASQDDQSFNKSVQTTHFNVGYFNWNFHGARTDLMPNIGEFGMATAPEWHFAVFEVNTSKMINGEEEHETRYYVSYPFELYLQGPMLSRFKKTMDGYFTKTVVEPAKKRSLTLEYYDDAITIMPSSFAYKTFAEAWAARSKEIENVKGNGYPQYDFLVLSNGSNNGEATSYPFCATTCTGERAVVTAAEMSAAQKAPVKKP
jgi:hypothetical protein